MADAGLDMELSLEGTEKAASGLDKVAKASAEVKGGAASATAETNGFDFSISNLSKSASAAKLALSGVGNLLKGNLVAGFSQLSTAAKIAQSTMTGVGASAVATAALVASTAAANILAIAMMYKTWRKEATSNDRWAAAQAAAAQSSAEIGRQSRETLAPVNGDIERMGREADVVGTTKELEASKANLEEKKKQLDEFFKWKADREFRGYGEGEKKDAASAEAQFMAEFEVAKEWVTKSKAADDEARGHRRDTYDKMIADDKDATEKRNAEIKKRQADEYQAMLDAGSAKAVAAQKLAAEEQAAKDKAAAQAAAAAVKAADLKARIADYYEKKKPLKEQLANVNAGLASLAGKNDMASAAKRLELLGQRDALQSEIASADSPEAADATPESDKPAKYSWAHAGGAGNVRRMKNSRGMMSGLRDSQFRSWATADGPGGKKETLEVKGVDKTNELLQTVAERLA